MRCVNINPIRYTNFTFLIVKIKLIIQSSWATADSGFTFLIVKIKHLSMRADDDGFINFTFLIVKIKQGYCDIESVDGYASHSL